MFAEFRWPFAMACVIPFSNASGKDEKHLRFSTHWPRVGSRESS